MNGAPVGVVEGGQIFFVRTDHIGRPVFATNDLGVKVWEVSYLPFGGVHTSTGGIGLRFPGQWFQSESGLPRRVRAFMAETVHCTVSETPFTQNWMRDYDPTTERYIQADPLGLVDGASVYGYALQNPLRYIDPTGELVPIVPMFIGAVAGGTVGAIAGYIQTGCAEGAWAGFAVGAFSGAMPLRSFVQAAAASSFASGGGQAVAHWATEGVCGCKQNPWNWNQFLLVTATGTLGGLGGYGMGQGLWGTLGDEILSPYFSNLTQSTLAAIGELAGNEMWQSSPLNPGVR